MAFAKLCSLLNIPYNKYEFPCFNLPLRARFSSEIVFIACYIRTIIQFRNFLFSIFNKKEDIRTCRLVSEDIPQILNSRFLLISEIKVKYQKFTL